jgi:hypothetical protein
MPLNIHHTIDKGCYKDSIYAPLFCLETLYPTERWGKEDFPRYIQDYTRHTLTYRWDALNAIKGVLRYLERKRAGVYNF